jgi:hypothetical protein
MLDPRARYVEASFVKVHGREEGTLEAAGIDLARDVVVFLDRDRRPIAECRPLGRSARPAPAPDRLPAGGAPCR